MVNNSSRDAFSKKAVELSHTYKNLLLEFATGTGKTKASLDIINNHRGTWLVVVSEKAHLKNWIDDIKKHEYEYLLDNITFVLYASLHKHINKSYYGIVLDEAHRCQSDLRRNALNNIKYLKSILLTATITKSEKFKLEEVMGHIFNYKISLSDAINENILPEPVIHLNPLELDNTDERQSFVIKKGVNTLRQKVTCNYKNRFENLRKFKHIELTVTCTELEKYNYLCEQIDYYKTRYLKERTQVIYNKWMNLGSVRKKYLTNLKTPHVKHFINSLPSNNRFICFTGSIEQCNSLGSANTVHSKIKNPQNIIDKFNNKETNQLYVVDMLREGVNLVDADGIIVQLDSKSRSAVQMLGRSLRKQFPVIHIFYYKNTIDENYLNNSTEEFEEFVVKS